MYKFGWVSSSLFLNLDGTIHANRFRVPELNPFFANRVSGHALTIANRRLRANRLNFMRIWVFLRLDSRESPRFALRIAGRSKLLSASASRLFYGDSASMSAQEGPGGVDVTFVPAQNPIA